MPDVVCSNGVTVEHRTRLTDSSGLSMSDTDIKCTGGRRSCTGLSEHANQPRKLWRSLSVLLGKNTARTSSPNCPSAQQLLDHFIEKVASVRRSTGGSEALTVQPATTTHLDQFVACLAEDIRKVITAAPVKSCALDPVPTEVLKTFLPELLPYITAMCNASLL